MSVRQRLIALVDCNAFYASCECVFRPHLWNQPVGVLSNNDGCFIARNQPLKALGVNMGAPYFQVTELLKKHNVQVFSANFALYADLSARVMATLEEFTPDLTVYSIDEAFLELTHVYPCYQDPIGYGHRIKQTVGRNTGIPVGVGFGPTKTLAKLANYAAKHWSKTGGVVDLSDSVRRGKLMRIVPVGEVWGVGRRTAEKLETLGIHTVWDLARQSPSAIQHQFNIVLARTVQELNGIACLTLDDGPPGKQQIIRSRSFSRRLMTFQELAAALSEFCARAAEKLRDQRSVASSVTVFIRTNPFNSNEPQYQRTATVRLQPSTHDTRIIVAAAKRLLDSIFRPGYRYQKCGVQLDHLQPAESFRQADLFGAALETASAADSSLMAVVDQINRRFPKSISPAAAKMDRTWQFVPERLSPAYTTNWRELPVVQCV